MRHLPIILLFGAVAGCDPAPDDPAPDDLAPDDTGTSDTSSGDGDDTAASDTGSGDDTGSGETGTPVQVPNPSFEEGSTGWTERDRAGPSGWEVLDDFRDATDGSSVAMLTARFSDAPGKIVVWSGDLEEGDEALSYTLCADMAVADGDPFRAVLRLRSAVEVYRDAFFEPSAPETWERVCVEPVTPANNDPLRIELLVEADEATVVFDRITLTSKER